MRGQTVVHSYNAYNTKVEKLINRPASTNLKSIMLSERSQTQKRASCVSLFLCNYRWWEFNVWWQQIDQWLSGEQRWRCSLQGARHTFWRNALDLGGCGGDRVCTLVKTHHTVHLRWVHCIVGNIHLSEVECKVLSLIDLVAGFSPCPSHHQTPSVSLQNVFC